MLVSGVKFEKLQPVSVAGNPVGQCLSCKLLKIHPQFKMHPGLGAPEDNKDIARRQQGNGSYITLARISEDYEKCGLPGFGDVPGAGTWHLNFQVPGALCKVTGKVGNLGIPEKGSQNRVQKCSFQVASALHLKVMAKT